MKTNEMGSKIIENRYIGKVQLNADDMGGTGCSTWKNYTQLCDNVVRESWKRLIGKGVDADTLGISVTGLFTLFGVEAKATPAYQNRLMCVVIERIPQKSDTLKNAIKAKSEAKKAYDAALAGDNAALIEGSRVALETRKAEVDALYLEPNHYWFEKNPMLDKKTRKHATEKARKAIEDEIADIINERDLMTLEELEAEAQRLADERKGRIIRKREEAKAKKQAEAEATTTEATNA